MFFIISSGQKEVFLPLQQIIKCQNCNQYTEIKIIMLYSYFAFFFIPLFKWNKRYFVKTNCCQSVCEISKDIGVQIEKGTLIKLDPNTLHFTQSAIHRCKTCGYQTKENFTYCPKCGNIM